MDRAYDARTAVDDAVRAVRSALDAADCEYVRLPGFDVFDPVIVVDRAAASMVVRALRVLDPREGWDIDASDGADSAVVRRRIVSPDGRELSTPREAVTVLFWERLPDGVERVDGSTHLPGTLHRLPRHRRTVVDYLTPEVWRTALEHPERQVDIIAPRLQQVTEPVDVVYTWVDGDDPEWLKRKNAALLGVDISEVNETAHSASRFASRDELKYSLRSLEMYSSWVNHIYLVTDRQVPDWLVTDHPKLTVVDHTEIFTDPSALPVFNSHAIESQLHHIPGLAERYLYLNDDVFFCRPTSPELFYTGNGLSKFYPSKAVLDVDPPSARDLPVMAAAKNNRRFMIETHGRTVTNKFKHTPHPQLRSVLQAMEDENPELFAEVAASRVRHPADYSIPSALYHFHAYAIGRAVEGRIRYGYLDIARPDAALRLLRFGRRTDLDVLCLNDTNTSDDQQEQLAALLGDFLEDRFPVPSSFEV
ncbi:stealth family protein [Brevibacterium sp. R8603A2]|nr:stealth family protein [Brevibacterium sp. R8603A2]